MCKILKTAAKRYHYNIGIAMPFNAVIEDHRFLYLGKPLRNCLPSAFRRVHITEKYYSSIKIFDLSTVSVFENLDT